MLTTFNSLTSTYLCTMTESDMKILMVKTKQFMNDKWNFLWGKRNHKCANVRMENMIDWKDHRKMCSGIRFDRLNQFRLTKYVAFKATQRTEHKESPSILRRDFWSRGSFLKNQCRELNPLIHILYEYFRNSNSCK